MIVLFGALAGAITGAALAKKRKGTTADMLQYGFVYGLVFALLGLFITLMIHRVSV